MRTRWISLAPLVLVLVSVASSSPPLNGVALDRRSPGASSLAARDDSPHHHKGAPLLEIDESQVLSEHQPTPPSYYTADWEDEGHPFRHGNLMIVHGIFMGLAFFISWPLGITLRSVKHPLQGLATLSFYILCVLGCAASGLYRKLTPDMYEHAVHHSQGYAIILFAISLSSIDILAAIRRVIAFTKSSDRSFRNFWRMAIKRKDDRQVVRPEYISLDQAPEEIDLSKGGRESVELQNVGVSDERNNEQWVNDQRRYSTASEQTVFGPHSPPNHSTDILHDPGFEERPGLVSRIGHVAFVVAERALVFAGYGQFMIGIVTYTGGCRQNYLNGCLAHLIKGSIFWCYGLATFGRFLGAFADIGWAWNRSQNPRAYSAEFVESLVIFAYGITNTWMERFGAHPGDPYTTRQIQHISIAVMFWFAGLIGMGIESQMVRKWLASSSSSMFSSSNGIISQMPREAVEEEPPSYRSSFNPFPALVIGVTGSAMAAHAQVYLFQVQIHSLWGNLLVAFSILRCLTYFFLWLGPPKSILPSRPPTEALGSFFLACGGLVFMFSTQEVTFAAMRRGRDDVMMFLNVAVAITCFAFCWTFYIIAFKGWLKSRTVAVIYRNA